MSPRTDVNLHAEQLQREKRSMSEGVARYWRKVERAEKTGEETTASYGQHILATYVEEISASLYALAERQWTQGDGRPTDGARFLRALHRGADKAHLGSAKRGMDVLAFALLKTLIDEMSRPGRPTTAITQSAANNIEKELRALGIIASSTTKLAVRSTLPMLPEDAGGRLKIVSGLLVHCMEISGLFTEKLVRQKQGKTEYIVCATEKLSDLVNQFHHGHEELLPRWLPMAVPPQPWDPTGQHGGYLSITRSMVKRHPSPRVEVTEVGQMAEAVNVVQATAWKINEKVLDVMSKLYKEGVKVGKMPARPARLKGKPTRKNFEAWGRYAIAGLTLNVAEESKRFEAIYFPHQVDWRGRLYAMPSYLNPQGPDYARGLLTFAHGKPLATLRAAGWLAVHGANTFGFKGTFEERHAWVEEHDEKILDCAAGRLQWWQTADDPFQFLAFCFEWQGYEQQGLAFVSSLPVALDGTCNGLQHYACMLRDRQSGTAVNLTPPQILHTLSADEQDVMQKANLGPIFEDRGDVVVEKPQDLYTRVAERVAARLASSEEETYLDYLEQYAVRRQNTISKLKNQEKREKAQRLLDDTLASGEEDQARLLELPIKRKMVKPHAMTIVYGSTLFGRRDTLRDHLTGKYTGIVIWRPVPGAIVTYLTRIIEREVIKEAPAVERGMWWIGQVARALESSEMRRAVWTTPAGFTVTHEYQRLTSRRVETRTLGSTTKRQLRKRGILVPVSSSEPYSNVGVAQLAPNLVHSFDACHLALSVLASHRQHGIESFSVIHDSFATTASDIEEFASAIKSSVRDLYTGCNPLQLLRDYAVSVLKAADLMIEGKARQARAHALGLDLNLAVLPPVGDLDLAGLPVAEFFVA